MTISAKLSDVGGLEFVVSDPTDTDDVNGFSDKLSVIGAKSCKYSGGTIMQSNSGKKIGVSQIKLTGIGFVRSHSVLSGSFGSKTVTGIGVTVDFGTIGIGIIKANVRHASSSQTRSALEISTDNVVWTEVSNINTNSDSTFDHNGGTQTFRYARINVISVPQSVILNTIFEESVATTALIRLRSSVSQDTANGTILKDNITVTSGFTLTLSSELLLVESLQYLTFEIISFANGIIEIDAIGITTVTEV